MAGTINYYGYNPPFFGGHQNILSRQSGERLIKNDLIQLILTSPGERVKRPAWGTIARRAVFDQLTPDIVRIIVSDVSEAIAKYDSRVQVSVTGEVDEEQNQLILHIIGHFTGQPNEQLDFEVGLPLNKTGV